VACRQKSARHHVRRPLSHGVTKGARAQNSAQSHVGGAVILAVAGGILPEPTFADAILERLVHNAYRVQLDGQSMRKTKLKTGDESTQN